MKFQVLSLLSLTFFGELIAECPNACSNHGKCGAYDMCTCYKNWMANDCSQRVCQFNRAFVDSPKGDLDASGGKPTGPDTTVVCRDAIYPYGTQEQFPNMVDTLNHTLDNSAHDYMECSNKGVCDRTTGTCVCFEGYEGSACQRASCPSSTNGVCSGFGTCETIETLTKLDGGNTYSLWDKSSTMGCKCDPGYSGPDCSQKMCKFGADPLYYNDFANIRYANFTYEIYVKDATKHIYGNYSLIFTDKHGKSWQTAPIDIGADCDGVTDALEALPNVVIPKDSVRCYQHSTNTNANVPIYNTDTKVGGANTVRPKFTLAFSSNPGEIKQIGINKYLDGKRPTLYSDETTSTLNWHIYANGFTGEDLDVVPDLCEGITVTLSTSGTVGTHVLSGLSAADEKKLKKCLGDSDGNAGNNKEVYNWDYGNENSYANPHLIKLIDATQDLNACVKCDPLAEPTPFSVTPLCTSITNSLTGYPSTVCSNNDAPGFYAVVFYNGTDFNVFTRVAQDYDTSTRFHVYTTTGHLQRISTEVDAFSYDSTLTAAEIVDRQHSSLLYLSNNTSTHPNYYGAVDCVSNPKGTNGLVDCLNKNDLVVLLNVGLTATTLGVNPVYPNIYTVEKVGVEPKTILDQSQASRHILQLNYGINADYSTTTPAAIYKFTPPSNAYEYVQQCSGRGLCDNTQGICQCFPGYTGDDCGLVNSLAL